MRMAEHGSELKRIKMKDRVDRDIERYGRDILQSAEMNRAYGQTHHIRSNLGDHTLRVAAASLVICYILRRIHIKTDIQAVVKGSLCHDLGMLGRHEKYQSNRECGRKHSADSVEVARELVDGLSDKTTGIIERHMWPSGRSKPPNSLEGVIVSAADKFAAGKDFVRGSGTGRDGGEP